MNAEDVRTLLVFKIKTYSEYKSLLQRTWKDKVANFSIRQRRNQCVTVIEEVI